MRSLIIGRAIIQTSLRGIAAATILLLLAPAFMRQLNTISPTCCSTDWVPAKTCKEAQPGLHKLPTRGLRRRKSILQSCISTVWA